MKKILMASLAVGILATAAPITAHAAGETVKGGCNFASLNDTTPDGSLGGQNSWNGEIDIEAVVQNSDGTVATNVTAAHCEIVINGGTGIDKLDATGPGVFVAAGSVQFTTSSDADVVQLCTVIPAIGYRDCPTADTTQIVPQPVIDALDLVLNTLIGVLDTVDPTLQGLEKTYVDPIACQALIALKPVADAAGAPLLYIDADGDTFIGGHTDADLFWDCPAYRS